MKEKKEGVLVKFQNKAKVPFIFYLKIRIISITLNDETKEGPWLTSEPEL